MAESAAILTDEQVAELTGYTQPGKQIAALRKMGLIPFIRPDGRPSVMAAAVVQVQTAGKTPAREPDFSRAA